MTRTADDVLGLASDVLVIGGGLAGCWAASAARRAGALVCLNAAPYRELSEALRRQVDVLVVNAIEAEQLCEVRVDDLASAARAAQTLCATFPSAVVTAGGDGVAWCDHGTQPATLPAHPVELVSTHGAGDAFVGTLAATLATGESLEASIKAANRAAAAHVSAAPT